MSTHLSIRETNVLICIQVCEQGRFGLLCLHISYMVLEEAQESAAFLCLRVKQLKFKGAQGSFYSCDGSLTFFNL